MLDKESIPDCTSWQSVTHGGKSLMLWNCMTLRGLGDLQRVGRAY